MLDGWEIWLCTVISSLHWVQTPDLCIVTKGGVLKHLAFTSLTTHSPHYAYDLVWPTLGINHQQPTRSQWCCNLWVTIQVGGMGHNCFYKTSQDDQYSPIVHASPNLVDEGGCFSNITPYSPHHAFTLVHPTLFIINPHVSKLALLRRQSP